MSSALDSDKSLNKKENITKKDVKLDNSPTATSTAVTKKSAEDLEGPIGRFFLTFLNPLFKIGSQRTLNHEDLGVVSEQDKCLKLYETFLKHWQDELKKEPEKRSLWLVLWRTTTWTRMLLSLLLYAIGTGISYGPILILNQLVLYFQSPSTSSTTTAQLWIFVAMMFVFPMSSSLFLAQSNVIMSHIGIQFRNCLVNMIYRKALRLSPAARQTQSTGMIVNMFSNDTKQLQMFLYFFNNICIAPFQIIACIILIYMQVGPATFVGIGLMLISVPLNVFIFLSLNKVRQQKVKKTDIRVKLMNEILAGIRVIKYYAWEKAFQKNITSVRLEELVLLRKMAYIVAFGFTMILFMLPLVQPILIFYTYVKLGNQLTSAVAFTTIAYFNMLQFPFAFLPMGISQYSQSLVSTGRMLKFFVSEELDPYVTNEDHHDDIVIEVKDLSICWIKPDESSETVETTVEGIQIKEDENTHSSNTTSAYQPVSNVEESSNTQVNKVSFPDTVATDTVPVADDVLESHAINIDVNDKKDMTDNTATAVTSGDSVSAAVTATANNDSDTAETTDEKTNLLKPTQSTKSLSSSNTLKDLNISIKKGQLVAVVGMVGSGKSSLLNALLGEMHLQNGAVNVVGSIAYCEQRPWILNSTVEENILFGEKMNQQRFDAAIHAACLEDDIKVLPGGILTEIGERGINLSGGQKARIALARAVYKHADIYFLDDPLSAVDAHVGQHIFKHCIRNTLKGTTRILVTHHIHLLNQCDHIIILSEGAIKAQGSYEELERCGVDISSFVPFYESDDESDGALTEYGSSLWSGSEADSDSDSDSSNNDDDDDNVNKQKVNFDDQSTTTTTNASTTMSTGKAYPPLIDSTEEESKQEKSDNILIGIPAAVTESDSDINAPATDTVKLNMTVEEEIKKGEDDAKERRLDKREATTIIAAEERQEGDVTWDIYSYYIRAGGIGLFAIIVFALLATQAAGIVAQFYLAFWGDQTAQASSDGGLTTDENLNYLGTYAWLTMLPLAFILTRSLGLANHRLGTSEKLHREVLQRILNAPVAFFDITPLGRILNRFSSDMLTVDEELSQTISQLSNSVFQCIGAIAAVVAATKGTFLVICVPLAFFYYQVQKLFRKTNTAVARLEAVARSPIYTDFSQALTGAISIRAFKEQDRFIHNLEYCVDNNSIAAITQQLCSNWLAIRLDFVGACTTFFIALVAVATNGNFLPAGYIALGLVNAFQVTTYLKFAVRMLASAEAQMNSVERLKSYSENTPQEGNDPNKPQISEEEVPPDWPRQGEIKCKDVYMSYREGPLVLKGLTFNVRGGMKVGIAGRTGAGKSSLMIALFRIQEIEKGSITIDGIDTACIPLSVLRSKLGIIPQDPVMFSATIRFNLDPFNELTDMEIWDVLESVDMKGFVSAMGKGLNEEVAEGGDNFSSGQRQLICIARALLRKPKILVLDEATASIDNETDALIQRTIRSSFKESTVLTIAHRLHTIIDSDRIMVLDQGKLAEWGPPVELLEKPIETGIFRSLWDKHQQSHQEADYPEYHLKDEIKIKRNVLRSVSSLRVLGKSSSNQRHLGRTSSSERSKGGHSRSSSDSHRKSIDSLTGSADSSHEGGHHKKSKRHILSKRASMRDSITSITEEKEEDVKAEDNITNSGETINNQS